MLEPPIKRSSYEPIFEEITLYDEVWLRQILTPTALVDVEYELPFNENDEWKIKFYSYEDRGEPNNTTQIYTPDSAAVPFAEWTIQAFEANVPSPYDSNYTLNYLKVTQSGAQSNHFEWHSIGQFSWVLVRKDAGGNTLQTEWVTSTRSTIPGTDRPTLGPLEYLDKTYETKDDQNKAFNKFTERYSWVHSRVRVLEERAIDPDGLNLVTEWTYYDPNDANSPNPPFAVDATRIHSVLYPDGSKIVYDYDAQGRLIAENHPWKDDLPSDDATDPCAPRRIEYGYTGTTDWRATSMTEYVGTVPVTYKTWTYDEPNDGTNPIIYERHYLDPVAKTTYRETKFTFASATDDRLTEVIRPNGLTETYATPVAGTYNSSTKVFTVDSTGRYEEQTVTYGPNAANKSMQVVSVVDPQGNTWYSEQKVFDGTSHETVSWTARTFDEHGRQLTTEHSNGTSTSQVWGSSCCSPGTTTNEYGQETTVSLDGLGRVASRTQEGAPAYGNLAAEDDVVITMTYSVVDNYDPDSTGPIAAQTVREVKTVVSGGTESLTTYRRYDMAGRVLAETDAAGLTTTYLYEFRSPAGTKTTITYPGGATRITETYADGRVKSVTGTAVVEEHRDYTVPSAGKQTTSVTTGPVADGRTRKTTIDALGRVIEIRAPGYDATTPGDLVTTNTYYAYTEAAGTAGQLKSTETVFGGTAVQNQTLYEYDEVGNLYRWGIDGDGENEGELKVGCFGCGDGGVDITAVDRITDEVVEYEEDSSGWLRKTTRTQYRKMGGTIVPSVEKQRLSGFAAGVVAENIKEDIYGNLTTVTTTLDTTKMLVTRTTSFTATDKEIVSVTRNGRALSTTDRAGLEMSYEYDSLGRTKKVIDSRGNATETSYDSDGRVAWTKDGGGNQTSYEYDPATGRLDATKNPDDKYTRYAYSARGEIEYKWGHVPQPVRMQYNDHGERTHLHTYRDEAHVTNGWEDSSGWPGGSLSSDVTEWEYDDATGLLLTKTYADSKTTTYTYTPDGKPLTRSWARLVDSANLKTTYAYDATYGDMTSITYSDAGSTTVTPTPPVTMTYLLTGAIDTVTDAAGTRTFKYDSYLRPKWETFTANGSTPALYGADSRLSTSFIDTVTYEVTVGQYTTYENANFNRLTRIAFGTTSDDDATYEATYSYDADTTRLSTIKGPGLHNDGVLYSYDDPATPGEPGSNLVTAIDYVKNGVVKAKREFAHRPKRNLLKHTAMIWDPAGTAVTKSKYTYRYDELARRTDVTYDGTAFSQVEHDAWGYNARNELISSERFDGDPNGTGSSQPTLDREYEYDPIGNRLEYTEGTDPTLYYCTNQLNQYDETGGNVQCSTSTETFEYDFDGNLTLDADFTYEWDAENRLIAVLTRDPSTSDDKKLTFGYDYRNRRVWKKVFDWDPVGEDWESDPSVHRKFVWHNWLMIAELDGSDNSVVRRYTWGLDLAGLGGGVNSLDDAGGIGGCLAIEDERFDTSTKRYLVCDNGDGNVTQMLLRSDGSFQAQYTYDSFGAVVSSVGAYAAWNPLRFSTKYWDSETGQGYWGYRYFSHKSARWLTRDPLGTRPDNNVYRFVGNAPGLSFDPDGRLSVAKWWSCLGCAGALTGKLGGTAGGCLLGCLETQRHDYPLTDCWLDCLSYHDLGELAQQFLDNPGEWVGAAACAKCGIDIAKSLIRKKTPPPPPVEDDAGDPPIRFHPGDYPDDDGFPSDATMTPECVELFLAIRRAVAAGDPQAASMMIRFLLLCTPDDDCPPDAPGPNGGRRKRKAA